MTSCSLWSELFSEAQTPPSLPPPPPPQKKCSWCHSQSVILCMPIRDFKEATLLGRCALMADKSRYRILWAVPVCKIYRADISLASPQAMIATVISVGRANNDCAMLCFGSMLSACNNILMSASSWEHSSSCIRNCWAELPSPAPVRKLTASTAHHRWQTRNGNQLKGHSNPLPFINEECDNCCFVAANVQDLAPLLWAVTCLICQQLWIATHLLQGQHACCARSS